MIPTRPDKASARNKLALSLGLIVASLAYSTIRTNDAQAAAVVPARPPSGQTSPIVITPAQSYEAAKDSLLQSLADLTSSTSVPTHEPKKTLAPVTSAPAPTPAPTPKPVGMYADGSYAGDAQDAYYGIVQVKAIVSSGKISDVQFLQYPNDRPNSIRVNSYAMPLLTQEAIQAQSAQVDGVSGATFTSQAFQQSLATALALAKN